MPKAGAGGAALWNGQTAGHLTGKGWVISLPRAASSTRKSPGAARNLAPRRRASAENPGGTRRALAFT